MAYTPNPTDPTQPLDSVAASTAAAEFRALKQYVQSIVSGGGLGVLTPGMIADFPGNPPPGWLELDGSLKSRATFPNLWAYAQAFGVIVADAVWSTGSNFGSFSDGDGSTTFRLPDFRSMHRRGRDNGRGWNGGLIVGKFNPPYSDHKHPLPVGYDGSVVYAWQDGSLNPIFGSAVVASGPPFRSIVPFTSSGNGAIRIGHTDVPGNYGANPSINDWNQVAANVVTTCIKT